MIENLVIVAPALVAALLTLRWALRQHSGGVPVFALALAIELTSVVPPLLSTSGAYGRVGRFDLVAYGVALSALCAAYVAASAVHPKDRSTGSESRPESVMDMVSIRQLQLLLVGLVALTIFQNSGLPPVVDAIRNVASPDQFGDAVSSVRDNRRSRTKAHYFGGAYRFQGLIEALLAAGWPLAGAISGAAIRQRHRIASAGRLTALATIALGLSFNLASGVRTAVVLFAGAAGLGWLGRRRITAGRSLALVACAFVVLLSIVPLSKGSPAGDGLSGRASAIVSRIADGNGTNNVLVLRAVNDGRLPVQGGSVMGERLVAILPGGSSDQPFANRLLRVAGLGNARSTGYLTSTQLGNLYADGKWPAVFLGYLFTGLFLGVLESRRRSWLASPSALTVGFGIACTIAAARMVVVGVPGILVSLSLLWILRFVLRLAFRHGGRSPDAPPLTLTPADA